MKKVMLGFAMIPFLIAAQCPDQITIPGSIDTDVFTVDVDAEIQKLEQSVRDRGGDDLTVLTALCNSDVTITDCSAPVFPAEIPREIDNPLNPGNPLNVSEWILALEELDEFKRSTKAVPFDASSLLEGMSYDEIKAVRVTGIGISVTSNSINYGVPGAEVYFAPGKFETADLEDAAALIADGTLVLFGTLPAIALGYVTGDDEPIAAVLDETNTAAFSEALKQLQLAFGVRSEIDFPPTGTDPTFPKPSGQAVFFASVGLEFDIATPSIDEVLGAAQGAGGE